jgi:hypothetical protein
MRDCRRMGVTPGSTEAVVSLRNSLQQWGNQQSQRVTAGAGV